MNQILVYYPATINTFYASSVRRKIMSLETAVIGIIQLVIAIILAVVALYIGFSVLGKITKGIDEEKEIAKGNTAVGILVASVFIAIAIVVQSGVAGIFSGVSKALGGDGLVFGSKFFSVNIG